MVILALMLTVPVYVAFIVTSPLESPMTVICPLFEMVIRSAGIKTMLTFLFDVTTLVILS